MEKMKVAEEYGRDLKPFISAQFLVLTSVSFKTFISPLTALFYFFFVIVKFRLLLSFHFVIISPL